MPTVPYLGPDQLLATSLMPLSTVVRGKTGIGYELFSFPLASWLEVGWNAVTGPSPTATRKKAPHIGLVRWNFYPCSPHGNHSLVFRAQNSQLVLLFLFLSQASLHHTLFCISDTVTLFTQRSYIIILFETFFPRNSPFQTQ